MVFPRLHHFIFRHDMEPAQKARRFITVTVCALLFAWFAAGQPPYGGYANGRVYKYDSAASLCHIDGQTHWVKPADFDYAVRLAKRHCEKATITNAHNVYDGMAY